MRYKGRAVVDLEYYYGDDEVDTCVMSAMWELSGALLSERELDGLTQELALDGTISELFFDNQVSRADYLFED